MDTLSKAIKTRQKLERDISDISKQISIWNEKLSNSQRDLANTNREIAKELGFDTSIPKVGKPQKSKGKGKRPCAVCEKKGVEIFTHDARWHRWNPKVQHPDLTKVFAKK